MFDDEPRQSELDELKKNDCEDKLILVDLIKVPEQLKNYADNTLKGLS